MASSTLPYPPLHKDAKFVILSDWDGTITNFDSNDYLTDNHGFGFERRRELNKEVLSGDATFRDAFREMLDSVNKPFDECKELLKQNIKLDTGFKAFFEWCKANGVPFIIVSSGMAPLIRAVLSNLIGDEDAARIDIISNDVRFDADGSWHIVYRHPESGFGHDKSQAILPYRDLPNPPTLFFFGDGVSDMSAAKHADVLFVKNDKPPGENDLAAYCVKQGIEHILFRTFADALPIVKDVVEGRKTVAQALAVKNAEEPEADFWDFWQVGPETRVGITRFVSASDAGSDQRLFQSTTRPTGPCAGRPNSALSSPSSSASQSLVRPRRIPSFFRVSFIVHCTFAGLAFHTLSYRFNIAPLPPFMTHADHSTESDWFYPYDGPIEPPPPPTRHPFAAAEISQPKPIPAKQSRSTVSKFESRERAGDDARSRSRSRSRDTKRKSQRSYQALDTGGGVGAYPAPEKDKDREQSVYSDHTFGVHSSHTTGHVRGRSSLGLSGLDPKFTFPWPDDSITVSSGGKHSDPPAVMFANHPFRMHTGSPPPRSHTASLSTSTTPWVRTITASPAPPDPAPMRKRTLTYQPGLVTMFGSNAETRVGYRTSGAFVDLDEREREKIRPTLLPPSLSLVGKGSNDDPEAVDEHGQRTHYDLRSHPYALNAPPVRETRFGSVSTTTTTTTGGTGKPPVPPRPAGLKLKSSLKASASTPELRIRIPSTIPASGHSAGRTPDELGLGQAGLGARPIPRSAPGPGSASAAAGPTSTFEARTICDALIFARPRFRVNAHEITPPESPKPDEEKRASVAVGESGFKGLACFPRKVSRDSTKDKAKDRPHPPLKEFKSLEDVLRDGEKLDREREEWNALGQGSLLNSRARSLSRSHTKSGGARVGIGRPRRDTHSVNEEGQKSGWGTLKLKRSVEMLAATAFSQGHGHAPSVSASSSRRGHGTLRSVSATSHVRGASTSVKSTAHSRAESWGQRVACGSRSGSSLGGETTGTGTHMGQSSEGLLPGGPKRTAVEDYPVVDIRPVPVGNTNRARAPPPPPGSGFNIAGPSRAHASPSKQRQSPGPSHALLYSMQSPSPSGSAIGLALSSPNGTTASLILPHPFAQRAGAYPADPGPPVTGPETIATRHRHPPRSSGSTEHARLDEPSHIIRTVPPIPSLSRSNTPSASKSAPPSDHPFVARQTIVGAPSGDVQRMFENAMLRSAEGEFDEPPRPSDFEVNPRRGSGDSGIGSSVNDYTGSIVRAAGLAAAVRGSAFGPPTGLDEMLAGQGQGQGQAPLEPQPSTSPKAASPQESAQSPQSPMDSLSPSSGSRRAVLTRTSSGMIDPALAGAASRSHESSSSSFSSPRPLGASIDDIESLRDIFYRPSPVPRVASHQDSPPTEHILSEEDEDVLSSDEEDDGGERTERQPVSGGGAHEDWTFGRRPFELQRESHLIWERRREGNDNTPLMINIAPGTPSPTLLSSAPASAPMYQDVPESVHDSDSQSERSVMTTSSQRATNENVTFGVVPSTQVDTLSVNVASRRQSTALSVIDMYDYESSSPNTPQIFQTMSPPYDRPSTFHSNTTDPYPRESYYTTSSAAGSRPGMDHLISGFPTPPAEGTSVSATVLSSYFAVDNQSRQAD